MSPFLRGAPTDLHDEVLPSVEPLIQKVEDPAALAPLKNTVTIAAEPIPVSKPGTPPQRIQGVAIWDDVPADAKRFTVFVSGLSNAWVAVEGKDGPAPRIRRKVLQLEFRRVGEEMRFV